MTDEMDNFTQQLNSRDLDKQKYHSCKIVDGLFKQFKESVGISFSIGAKHNVSSRTVLSSFDLSSSPSSMFCCLAHHDLLTRSLKKPRKHMSPAHIERAKGFASHSVLQIVTLDHVRLQNAKHCETIRSVILEARRDAAVDDRFSSRLESVSRALGDLVASVGSVVGLFEGLEEDFAEFDTKFARSATESWAKMKADLSAENHAKTFLEVRQSVGEFRKRVLEVSGDHQVHLEPCREGFRVVEELTSGNWSEIKKEAKNLPRGAVSKMSETLQSTLQRMLGGLQQAKSKLREVKLRPNEDMEPSFKAMERLVAAMDCLGLKVRSRELADVLAAKADLERLGFDGSEIANMFAEAAIVADGCVDCADAILGVAEQFSALANTFVSCELGMLSTFASHEFSSDDNEQEEGDAGDKGELGPAAEGCGLGEGKGEKATTEGVDSEDLFENPAEEQKEEENNEEDEDKKDEEHVDFSDRLDDGKNRDLEKDSDDDEESKDGSGDEGGDEEPEDVEEDAVAPDDAEELKPEDWGDEVDDEKQDQEDGDGKEEEEGEEDVNNAERGPDQNDRSGTQQQKDEEKRARQPDDQTGADIESQDEDRFHDPEYKEEEIEDLDMGDDGEAGNMDDGEEDNADEDMEQEQDIERLPDFADEVTEPEEGDKEAEADDDDEARVEASENVADGEMGEKRTDDNGKDNEGAGVADDDDAEKAEKERGEEEATDGGKGKAAAGRHEEEDGAEEEKDAEMEDGENETKVKRRRAEEDDFKDQAEDVDLQRDLNEDNSRFDEKSDAFAHKDEADDDDRDADAVAMDVIMAEEERKDSVRRAVRRNKPERKSDRKKEVRQDLVEDSPMVVDRDSLTESMLVSRGPTNAVSNAADVRNLTARAEETSDENAVEIEMDVCHDYAPEHAAEWARLSAETADLARLLAEQLRLIIEPTKATRLQGDFRSGKRINMRKVIAFIASNFRKDKIWLRRTRPSRRECEVVVAVDNSASMADADARRMAFMSVATLMQGLSVLEIGRMGILRFGERCSVVHDLKSSFGIEDGANVMSKFDFSDKSTGVVDLLRTARAMYGCNAASSSSGPASKLLVVVSDGRGIMNEGKAKVLEAVRATRAANVFVVFVIVEAEDSAQSILDIRVPIFDAANVLKSIESYMEHFPFPFYIILRDIRNLPRVLSDALRQWFELVSN